MPSAPSRAAGPDPSCLPFPCRRRQTATRFQHCEFLADVPDRRNVRAGDDGECGGGSGISHANAAGETDGGSACAGRLPADVGEANGERVPEAAVLLLAASPRIGGIGDRLVFDAGWVTRGDAMVSRHRGHASTAVSSSAARALSLPAASLAAEAGAPLAAAPLAGVSSLPPAACRSAKRRRLPYRRIRRLRSWREPTWPCRTWLGRTWWGPTYATAVWAVP